jgi:hypothetical protein
MELSPLAREKPAKIGEPSEEEKVGLISAGQLNALLADYYTSRKKLQG